MSEKRVLTAADIAAVSDQIIEEVPVPEWGGSVYIRLLPASAGLALQAATVALPEERKSSALFLLLAAVLVTPEGALLFPKADRPDEWDAAKAEEVLGRRQGEPLHRIQEAAVALRKQVEAEKKGASETTEASASSTA